MPLTPNSIPLLLLYGGNTDYSIHSCIYLLRTENVNYTKIVYCCEDIMLCIFIKCVSYSYRYLNISSFLPVKKCIMYNIYCRLIV